MSSKGTKSIPPIYRKRLHRLVRSMSAGSVAVFISPPIATRNRDVLYPFRNSSDLIYFTGINEENTALVVNSKGGIRFYCENSDPHTVRWTGSKTGTRKAAALLGLKPADCLEFGRFWNDLGHLLSGSETLYYSLGDYPGTDARIIETMTAAGRNTRAGNITPHTIVHMRELSFDLRLFKDEHDFDRMRKAGKVTANAHRELMIHSRQFRNGISENAMKGFIEAEFRRGGASFLAYPSIVAAGDHANVLHYEHDDGHAAADDLVLVDAGCEWEGYASDITRTFPAGGRFTPAQKEIYAIVLQAQKKCIAAAGIGSDLGRIHKTAIREITDGLWELGLFKTIPSVREGEKKMEKPESRAEVIEKQLYRHFYMHQTSHFLGLDVHDVGIYYLNGKHRPLENGMCFTVEPGIYLSAAYTWLPAKYRGIGIRIEDDIFLRGSKAVNLTVEAPKEIADIENL